MARLPKLKATILQAALDIAVSHGFHTLTRDNVAARAEVSPALVLYHFFTMDELRKIVMEQAVEHCCLSIVAQGMAMRHDTALSAPRSLRKAAALSLVA